MPKKNNMWFSEMASSFGMTANEFAEFLGYSKQSLYKASCGKFRLKPSRLVFSLRKLEKLSDKILEEDEKAASARYVERQKLIEDFNQRLSMREDGRCENG